MDSGVPKRKVLKLKNQCRCILVHYMPVEELLTGTESDMPIHCIGKEKMYLCNPYTVGL